VTAKLSQNLCSLEPPTGREPASLAPGQPDLGVAPTDPMQQKNKFVQQGRAVFAALIRSAQQVWKTFDIASMLIGCVANLLGGESQPSLDAIMLWGPQTV
jgi:hypothetical protein